MFEFIRTHQRLIQLLLLLLIFPSFAFFGLESYTRMSTRADEVANVAGHPILQSEWDTARRDQLERYRQAFGDRFDAKMFDTPEFRMNILDTLVAQRAIEAAIARNHLTVSTGALQQYILSSPGLQNAEGKFDIDRYKAVVATQGMTPAVFEARLARDLAAEQVTAAIQDSAFAPKTVAARLSDLNDQEREVQELVFAAKDYAGKVTVTDDMIKAYYDKNGKMFEVPESARIEYVVLSLDAAAAQVNVSDDDVKSFYDQNTKRFGTDEQRRASHILVSTKKGDKAAAKAKAEDLLAKVKKNPAEFAALAKSNSDDPGSAAKGGDLDFFGRGMMVKPFEEAAFSLKQGEISGLVESDFGYHIITVTGIKPAAIKPLAEVKGEIVAEIKKQLAGKKFSEMVETFSNTVYEQADSLKPAADKLKLSIQTASVNRHPNPAVAPTAPYNNEKFLTAVFSDEAVKNKRNTEAVEVAPSTMVAGRIVEHKPVSKRPLDEVKDGVRAALLQEEAYKLAKKAGEEKLAALKAKDDTAGFDAAKTVSRTKPVFGPNTAAVMKADVTKLPAYTGAEAPGQAYTVYRIAKVSQPANVDVARRAAEQQQIGNAIAQQELVAYVELLKQKAKAKITAKATAAAPANGDAAPVK